MSAGLLPHAVGARHNNSDLIVSVPSPNIAPKKMLQSVSQESKLYASWSSAAMVNLQTCTFKLSGTGDSMRKDDASAM